MPDWFMLVYKVPSEPSRYRASIWRKLKASGAIYLQNGVAALPVTSGNERLMRGSAQEIREVEGTAYLIRGGILGDGKALEAAFNAAREEEYREILSRCRDFHGELDAERNRQNFTFAELEENEEDLAKLEGWLAKVKSRDHFGASLGEEAEQAVAACRDDLAVFADAVYRAVDHGSAGPASVDDPLATSADERNS
jgi:hypothetical protein